MISESHEAVNEITASRIALHDLVSFLQMNLLSEFYKGVDNRFIYKLLPEVTRHERTQCIGEWRNVATGCSQCTVRVDTIRVLHASSL